MLAFEKNVGKREGCMHMLLSNPVFVEKAMLFREWTKKKKTDKENKKRAHPDKENVSLISNT